MPCTEGAWMEDIKNLRAAGKEGLAFLCIMLRRFSISPILVNLFIQQSASPPVAVNARCLNKASNERKTADEV